MDSGDREYLASRSGADYMVMIEPHVKALTLHVHGDGENGSVTPCEACWGMEPCEARRELLAAQDAAVHRWSLGHLTHR